MSTMFQGKSFQFLYREDKGEISQSLWWAGTWPLAAVLLVLSLIWLMIAPDPLHASHSHFLSKTMQSILQLLTYFYLLVYGIITMLIAISHTFLSMKRLRALHQPTGLGGLVPFTVLVVAAVNWLQPRMSDEMPVWSLWLADGVLVAVVLFMIYDLGIKSDKTAPH
ncbi:MAG: hypothetical protein KGQ37_03285 [Hyphomicrobiales bacterium]|nr:hypothetical protein [Hyphomicrobiales bacterium]